MFVRRLMLPLVSARTTLRCSQKWRCDSVAAENKVNTMMDVKREIVKKLGIQSTYSPLLNSREYLLQYEPKPDDLPARSMQDSFTSAIIPLSSDTQLQDKYVTFLGHVRLGRLMEDMDLFAVWVVHQHLKMPNGAAAAAAAGNDASVPLPYTIVTVLVDKITFTDLTPKHDLDIRLSGHVSWVGRSSVEVVVWLEQKCHGRWRKLTRALFLMASRNATNTKALAVNALHPATEEEQRIFAGGESRKKRRILAQKQSLFASEPNPFEAKLMHDMFVKSIDLKNMAFNQRVLPAGSVWMEQCVVSNIVFSHPEDRNAHNTVFGGFLMRHALELSFAAAYQFSKHRPKLVHISDISFQRSVEVSSFIKLTAHVVYTELNYMQIVVTAEVFDAASGQHNTTNMFYYTYSKDERVPAVVPKTYHEAMWYLDGRRRFQNAMNLDDTPEEPYSAITPPPQQH